MKCIDEKFKPAVLRSKIFEKKSAFAYLVAASRQCVIEGAVINAVRALRAINWPAFYDILYYGCLVRAVSSEAVNIGPVSKLRSLRDI